MIPPIGKDVFVESWLGIPGKTLVHVQDRNLLSQEALVGIPDMNGIVWDRFWVSFDRISVSVTPLS